MRMLWTAGLMLAGMAVAGEAHAQVPPAVYGGYGYPGAGGFAGQGPAFTRQNQPLSPYLNLELGRNRAVNYFSGVRPLLNAGRPAQGNFAGGALGGRQTYFPDAITAEQLDMPPVESKGPPSPTGHFTGFAPFQSATPAFSTFGSPSFPGQQVGGITRRPLSPQAGPKKMN